MAAYIYTTAPNFQGIYYRYYYSKTLFPNTILTDGAVLVYNTASSGPGSGTVALPFTYVSSVTNNIPRFFTWDYYINNDYVEVSITSSSLNMTDSEIPSGSTYYRVVGVTNQTLLQKNLSVDKLRDYNTAVQALGLNTQM